MALMGSKGGTKEWGSSKILRNLPSKKTMLFGYLEYYVSVCTLPDSYGVRILRIRIRKFKRYICIVFQSSAVRSERSSQLCWAPNIDARHEHLRTSS